MCDRNGESDVLGGEYSGRINTDDANATVQHGVARPATISRLDWTRDTKLPFFELVQGTLGDGTRQPKSITTRVQCGPDIEREGIFAKGQSGDVVPLSVGQTHTQTRNVEIGANANNVSRNMCRGVSVEHNDNFSKYRRLDHVRTR